MKTNTITLRNACVIASLFGISLLACGPDAQIETSTMSSPLAEAGIWVELDGGNPKAAVNKNWICTNNSISWLDYVGAGSCHVSLVSLPQTKASSGILAYGRNPLIPPEDYDEDPWILNDGVWSGSVRNISENKWLDWDGTQPGQIQDGALDDVYEDEENGNGPVNFYVNESSELNLEECHGILRKPLVRFAFHKDNKLHIFEVWGERYFSPVGRNNCPACGENN